MEVYRIISNTLEKRFRSTVEQVFKLTEEHVEYAVIKFRLTVARLKIFEFPSLKDNALMFKLVETLEVFVNPSWHQGIQRFTEVEVAERWLEENWTKVSESLSRNDVITITIKDPKWRWPSQTARDIYVFLCFQSLHENELGKSFNTAFAHYVVAMATMGGISFDSTCYRRQIAQELNQDDLNLDANLIELLWTRICKLFPLKSPVKNVFQRLSSICDSCRAMTLFDLCQRARGQGARVVQLIRFAIITVPSFNWDGYCMKPSPDPRGVIRCTSPLVTQLIKEYKIWLSAWKEMQKNPYFMYEGAHDVTRDVANLACLAEQLLASIGEQAVVWKKRWFGEGTTLARYEIVLVKNIIKWKNSNTYYTNPLLRRDFIGIDADDQDIIDSLLD